jgi:transcriptional regulator with XRE-family HTH domain
MTKDKIKKQIVALKTHYDLSIPEISERSGISHKTIENWMYSSKTPSIEMFSRYLKVFGYEIGIRKIKDTECD